MGKDKGPDLPAVPEYKEDPRFTQGLDQLFDLGGRLTNFDFSGGLSPLQDTISTSPKTTELFLKGLKAQLDPIFRDLRSSTINDLAANNQLESSVANNRMSQLESDITGQFTQQATAFGLADTDRALRNRIGLLNTGINTLSGATNTTQRAQEFENRFNLENYENRVAKAFNDYDPGSDIFGGVTGAIQGGMAGFQVGGPVGAIVGAGAGGYAGSQGYDVSKVTGAISTFPGQTASDSIRGGVSASGSSGGGLAFDDPQEFSKAYNRFRFN